MYLLMWDTEKDTMSVLFSPEIHELESTYEKISEKHKVRKGYTGQDSSTL